MVLYEIWSLGEKPFRNKQPIEVCTCISYNPCKYIALTALHENTVYKTLIKCASIYYCREQVIKNTILLLNNTLSYRDKSTSTLFLQLISTFQARADYIHSPPTGCPRGIYKLMILCW